MEKNMKKNIYIHINNNHTRNEYNTVNQLYFNKNNLANVKKKKKGYRP